MKWEIIVNIVIFLSVILCLNVIRSLPDTEHVGINKKFINISRPLFLSQYNMEQSVNDASHFSHRLHEYVLFVYMIVWQTQRWVYGGMSEVCSSWSPQILLFVIMICKCWEVWGELCLGSNGGGGGRSGSYGGVSRLRLGLGRTRHLHWFEVLDLVCVDTLDLFHFSDLSVTDAVEDGL